jgi:phage repressor protein C with HTH and peptisase S24 domain/DNA-binding Xre family transcriptional regulator
MSDEMNYIERIKQLKSEKKITNDRLSELTGIPLGTLSKILAGMNDSPKLSNVIAICNALGCSVDYIISGVPENTNNYTLDSGEIRLIEKFRSLDTYGQELAAMVIDKEAERITREHYIPTSREIIRTGANSDQKKYSAPRYSQSAQLTSKRSIMLYDMPMSAGTGAYLDGSEAVEINIPRGPKTDTANYAIRISGNSMEPKFHNGDILLIEESESVDIGELGIFVLDGDGYFKKYGGDCLISLNPVYANIMLKDFSDVSCLGRVVGKLRRK